MNTREMIRHELKEILLETGTAEKERENYKVFFSFGTEYISVQVINARIMRYYKTDIPVIEFLELRESDCVMARIRNGIKKLIEVSKDAPPLYI